MSDDILDPTPAPLKATPNALMSRSQSLTRQADEARGRAREKQDDLSGERDQAYGDHKTKRDSLAAKALESSADLASATAAGPGKAALPNPDLGPSMNQDQTRNFLFGILGMALVGAKGGRENFKLSLAAMNGYAKGLHEGNLDEVKQKQAEFKREFDIAMEKQTQMNDKYRGIIDSRKMSLNAQMTAIAVEAKAYGDEVTYQKAKQGDIDGIWKQVNQSENAADKLIAQAGKMQADLDKRREKAEEKAKAAGTPGSISQKYNSDEQYKKAVDFYARYFQLNGSLPPRFGQGATKGMYNDVMLVAPTLERGDPKDMRANVTEGVGQKAQARALGTRSAAIEQAASEAREMSHIVLDTSAKFERTNFPAVNKAIVAFEKNTGDTAVRQFGAAINSYVNAYARAVNPSGASTVSDKEHAREMLSTADSPEQVKAIIAVLDQEMTAAQNSPKNVKKSLRQEITGEGGGAPAAANARGWKLMKDANGNQAYVSPDGKQFEEAK